MPSLLLLFASFLLFNRLFLSLASSQCGKGLSCTSRGYYCCDSTHLADCPTGEESQKSVKTCILGCQNGVCGTDFEYGVCSAIGWECALLLDDGDMEYHEIQCSGVGESPAVELCPQFCPANQPCVRSCASSNPMKDNNKCNRIDPVIKIALPVGLGVPATVLCLIVSAGLTYLLVMRLRKRKHRRQEAGGDSTKMKSSKMSKV